MGRFWVLVVLSGAAIGVGVGLLGGPWWLPPLALPLLALVVERTSALRTADGRATTRRELLRVLAPERAAAEESAHDAATLAASGLRMLELEGWSGPIVRGGWGARDDRMDSGSILHLREGAASGDDLWEGSVSVEVAELQPWQETGRLDDLAFELGADLPDDDQEFAEIPSSPAELLVDGERHLARRIRVGEAEGVRATVGAVQVTVRSESALPHPLALRTARGLADYPEPL